MSDEEIIPKPDSSPVATALLVASCIGVLLATLLVWNELTAFYLTDRKLKVDGKAFFPPMKIHNKYQDGKKRDFYKDDFKNTTVEEDIQTSKS